MGESEERQLERFIPYRKSEIVRMLCEDGALEQGSVEKFRGFCTILQSLYHFEFHEKVEFLKDNYYPFNPDKDTKTVREYSVQDLKKCEQNLVEKFKEVLNDANYEEITKKDLEYAMAEESLFKISLFVDFDDYSDYLIFRRGDTINKVTVKKLFKKVELDVATFERVAMLIRFKDKAYFDKKHTSIPFEPGSMVIKLFKNIPKADLEMLFPNTQVRMSMKDKLTMGIPAAGGAVGVLLKAGAGLVAFAVVLATMLKGIFAGGSPSIRPEDIPAMVGGLTALGVIAGFVFKQWTVYKNRKIQFMKVLGDNLYFKNLDNNAGVFHHLIDAAEEEECKEAILGYYFLQLYPEGKKEKELDGTIEKWFAEKHRTYIDFEVDDALRKLKDLHLCTVGEGEDPVYKAVTLEEACRIIDEKWDNYFQYNV